MSILHALSTIPFFVNINQGIDRTLALLEVKEKTAALKGQPVLIDCINLMLCSLTVLENELTTIAAATDTAIAAATDTAIAAATDTAIAAATDTAIAAATDTVTTTVKTETEANRALSKFQKLWYLQQIEYPEIEELKGIASINAAIASVSTFMAAYKAVKNHGIPEKDPNKKSAFTKKSDKQTVDANLPVATANISDAVQVVKVIPSAKIEIAETADTTVNSPESDLIALPSTIKVNGVVTIKKP